LGMKGCQRCGEEREDKKRSDLEGVHVSSYGAFVVLLDERLRSFRAQRRECFQQPGGLPD
jgi:hypothetical protein